MADRDAEKRAAAEAAAELVRDGDKVGLGTGSTVAPMLPALAARKLNIRCVATSIATEVAARALGLAVEPFEQLDRLDIAIDGADQIDPDGLAGQGRRRRAHAREGRRGGGRPLRRDRVVGQGRRPDRGADPARAAGVRAARDAARCWSRPELRHVPLCARRRRDRRLLRRRSTTRPPPRRGCRPRPGSSTTGCSAPELVSDVLIARGSEIEHRTIGSSDRPREYPGPSVVLPGACAC